MLISGTVSDSTLEKNVPFGKALLIRAKDSTLVNHKTIDQEGNFSFSIPIDTFRLIINHPKYDEKEFLLVGSAKNRVFDLREIHLPEKGKGLEEVVILAFKEPIYYKGDTLVYVADSFKTRPNAMVEDLLRKLPGVKVEKDGSIKAQGKEVKRVLVDGDEFFGSDATLATKNLAAGSIQTVQIYEKHDDGASDTDEKIQVLDLKLKDEAKRGYFGEILLGSDFRRFHEGRVLANYFTPKHKVSVYGAGANTLESTLSWSQMNQYGLNNLQAYQYDSETDSWQINENNINSSSGLPQLWRAGVYYQGEVNKKLKIGANYTFTDYRLNTSSESNSRYNFADTSYSNAFKSNELQHSRSHEVNFSFDYQIDSTQTFSFKPKFLEKTTNSESTSNTHFLNQNGFATRNSFQINENSREGFNIKTPLTYTKLFLKKDRRLTVLNNFIYDTGTTKGKINYEDQIPETNQSILGIDQIKSGNSNIVSNLALATFTEPLGKKSKLQFSLEQFNTKNTDNMYSFNPVNGVYEALDSLTSNEFQSIKSKSSLGLNYIYKHKKITFNVAADASYFNSRNENVFTANTIKQSQLFVLPKFSFSYKPNKSSNLNVRGNTSANLPSNSILQPIYNNMNPNFVRLGAPDIKPSYNSNMSANYQFYKSSTGAWYYLYSSASYTHNSYANDITFDNNGRQYSTFYNKSLFSNFNIGFNLSQPIYKQEITISPIFSYNLSPNVGRVNGEETKTISNSFSQGLSIDFDYDFMYASIGASYDHSIRNSKLSEIASFTNTKWSIEAQGEFYLPWKMTIGFDANYSIFGKMETNYNVNRFILSARIEQKFGKTENWIITGQIHDALNQNQEIYRSNTVNMITDSRMNTIARYFMLKLTYKFNSATLKSKKNKNGNENDTIDLD